jgi:hypothetical protein
MIAPHRGKEAVQRLGGGGGEVPRSVTRGVGAMGVRDRGGVQSASTMSAPRVQGAQMARAWTLHREDWAAARRRAAWAVRAAWAAARTESRSQCTVDLACRTRQRSRRRRRPRRQAALLRWVGPVAAGWRGTLPRAARPSRGAAAREAACWAGWGACLAWAVAYWGVAWGQACAKAKGGRRRRRHCREHRRDRFLRPHRRRGRPRRCWDSVAPEVRARGLRRRSSTTPAFGEVRRWAVPTWARASWCLPWAT